MLEINLTADFYRFSAMMNDVARKQMPFAIAMTLTTVAKAAQADVTADLPSIFDRPTPFTRHAIAMQPARKDALTATVFVKDVQARYLGVQETGGPQVLHGRALLQPKPGAPLNAYGNLSKGRTKALTSKPNVFVGWVKPASGQPIWGFWQRPKRGRAGSSNATLKLLIRGGDGTTVPQSTLHFRDRVRRSVNATIGAAWDKTMAKVLATDR